MDDIVRQAMAKWPNVPHCHGWLGLDARGHWYLRDAQAQALGGFASGVAGARGTRLQHEGLIGFIQRNYAADDDGAWFFQNGPQRVYVELEAAPLVWRVDAAAPWAVQAHTGAAAVPRSAWVDERGRLFLDADLGLGIVHTLDMAAAADAVEQGCWRPREMAFERMPMYFGYQLRPTPKAGEPPDAGASGPA